MRTDSWKSFNLEYDQSLQKPSAFDLRLYEHAMLKNIHTLDGWIHESKIFMHLTQSLHDKS